MTVSPRHLLQRASPAVLAQALNSSSNFAVSAFVARYLGTSALGTFAILFGVLATLTALQTSWVGDSLTVLDRRDPLTRQGLMASQLLFTSAGLVVSAAASVALVHPSVATTGAFGALTTCWLLEEYGRRALMAELMFGRLALSDAAYMAVLVCGFVVMRAERSQSLGSMFTVMAMAAIVAYGVASASLPRGQRLALARPQRESMRRVGGYGLWRAAQAGSGMLSATVIRELIAIFEGRVVLGRLEIARLAVAPLFTFVGAALTFFLPTFSVPRAMSVRRPQLLVATGVLLGVSLGYSALALGMRVRITHLIAGGHPAVTSTMILEWLVVATSVAVFAPVTSLALVVGQPHRVFYLNFAGSVISVLGAAALVATGQASHYMLALVVGAVLSGGAMAHLVSRAGAAADDRPGRPEVKPDLVLGPV